MRLLKLTANQPSFHTVRFNESGISLIVAKNVTNDEKNTYNSVGKSLTIALVHFCLGCNKIDDLEEKLPGWIFSLDFDIDGIKYTSSRAASNQDVITLNTEELSLTDFRNKLGKDIFKIEHHVPYLTFRSLISRFIRPTKSSYNDYFIPIAKEQDYARLLNAAYLLGLDIERVVRKEQLKTQFDDVSKLGTRIEKDATLKAFFLNDTGEEDLEINIVKLEEKIKRLDQNIKSFVIAEDYTLVKKEADSISAQLHKLRNEATKLAIAIKNIQQSLAVKPDISKEQLISFYNEAKVVIGEMVLKRLEELEQFNSKILESRSRSLTAELREFENRLAEINSRISSLEHEEDKKLAYLGSHGALDDYTALMKVLSETETKLSSMKQYKQLISEYKTRQQELKMAFAEENLSTEKYLEDVADHIKRNISLFNSLTDSFYADKPSGISITNNDGTNKLRFTINAKITDDAGDGVNDVRTFCYDWALLLGHYNHNVDFIFHDSRIVSDLDSRQMITMLKVAKEKTSLHDYQYILSLNEANLKGVQELLSPEEYKTLVTDNIILELTDESNTGKLLGIQVDLKYSKE